MPRQHRRPGPGGVSLLAVRIFGGAGYMRGIKVERIYREVEVNAIGGGSEEIMKDLASRQMGL
jgi:acyl-CoA dehydrogenase